MKIELQQIATEASPTISLDATRVKAFLNAGYSQLWGFFFVCPASGMKLRLKKVVFCELGVPVNKNGLAQLVLSH